MRVTYPLCGASEQGEEHSEGAVRKCGVHYLPVSRVLGPCESVKERALEARERGPSAHTMPWPVVRLIAALLAAGLGKL
jgi:hypothetical protein